MPFSPLAISAITVLITFVIAAWQDFRTRKVYRVTWYPAAGIGIICAVIFWIDAIHHPAAWIIFLLSILLAAFFAAFAFFGMFGWADAKALILLSLAVPVTPFANFLFPSLVVSTIINAGLLLVVIPAGCLIYNLAKKNRAPFWLMCSGYPVLAADVPTHHGFIAEDISETNGVVTRRFIRARDAIFALRNKKIEVTGVESVWMTIGIPLLVPLTAGLILAMFGVSALDIVLTMIL